MPSLESLDCEFEEFKKDHPVILLEKTGSKMEFSVCGKGEKTILLFRGLAGNAHSVYRFVTALEKKYKVVRASKVLSVLPWVLLRPLFRVRLLRLFRVAKKLSQDQIALLTFGRSQFLEHFKSLSKELLVSHSNLSFDFMLNSSIPVLSNWNGKLLVIYSPNDPATRNGSLLFQTAYPFAKMVGIKNVGHLGSLLHFEEYIAEIKSVLE